MHSDMRYFTCKMPKFPVENTRQDVCNHVNNKICHAHKSKVMSRRNITSCENSSSRLLEIPQLVRKNFYFHGKLWHSTYMQIIYVTTCVHAWINEVIIEQYCILYSNVSIVIIFLP